MSNPLPKNWVEVPIGEIAHINPPLDRCLLDENTEITFLGMSSVLPEHRGISEPGLRPYREVSKGYTRFVEGDVLVAKITPCMENGKVVVAAPLTNTIGCGSTEFHVFRPRPGIDPGWISRFLWRSDIRHLAKTHMTGAVGQQRVPTGFFEYLTIPVPSTSEQRRIIPILDDTLAKIDEAEEALERVRRNLDRYRASVLKAACEGRLVPTEAEQARQENRDYEPASELLKRILIARREAWEKAQLEAYAKKDKTPPKDWKSRYPEPQTPDTSQLPKLPEGWCWASIDQLVAKTNYGTSVRCDFESTGVPVLRIPNISAGKVSFEKLKFATADLGVSIDDYLELGDLIICRTNGSLRLVGKCAVYDTPSTENTHFASYLIRLRFVLRAEHGRWIWAILSSPMGRGQIEAIAASSAGQHNISLGNLQQFPVPLPPLLETSRIIEKLGGVEAFIETLCKSSNPHLQKLSTLRQSLLKHAFCGKLVPQDPADEPASELLDRIRAQRREMEGGTTPRKRVIRKTKKSS